MTEAQVTQEIIYNSMGVAIGVHETVYEEGVLIWSQWWWAAPTLPGDS